MVTKAMVVGVAAVLGIGLSAGGLAVLLRARRAVDGADSEAERVSAARDWIRHETALATLATVGIAASATLLILQTGAFSALWAPVAILVLAVPLYPLSQKQLRLYARLLLGVDVPAPPDQSEDDG